MDSLIPKLRKFQDNPLFKRQQWLETLRFSKLKKDPKESHSSISNFLKKNIKLSRISAEIQAIFVLYSIREAVTQVR